MEPRATGESGRVLMGAPGRYPTMKDSGVEWLGDVPVHWGCQRLKTLCTMQSGEAITAETIEATGEYPVYGGNGVRGFSSKYTHDGTYALIGRQGALCGNVRLAQGRFWASEHAVVTRLPGDHVPEWFVSVLTVMNLNQYSVAAAQPGLSVDRVLNLWVPVPPQCEQRAIARFLDYATSRIDRCIHAKEKLITLLEEQKQAVIHAAVTGQIDVRTGKPYLKYKRSRISLIEDVPKCWKVRRLKTIARIRYGLGQPPREVPDGLPMLRATNICRGEIVEKDMVYVDPKEVPIGRNALLAQEEILVVRSGAYTADSAIVPQEYSGAVAGYDLVVAATGVSPRFLAFALLAGYVRDDQLIVASLRAAQPHLNAEELGVALVLLPSWQDQVAIAEYLDTVTRQIQTTITHGRRQIELLGEYRNRLIADVVSGKIDVREVAAALPDEGPFAYKGTLDEVRRFHKKQG